MVERGAFKCWTCPDVKGDVIDFVRLWGKMDWKEAVEFLGTCSGAIENQSYHRVERKRPELRDEHITVLEALYSLTNRLDSKCRDYLSGRGVDPDLAEYLGVRCMASPIQVRNELRELIGENHPGADVVFNERGNLIFHMHRLLFPYWDDNNRLVFMQGRDIYGKANIKEMAVHVYPTVPWIMKGVLDYPSIYVAEGVIDCLTLLTKGRPAIGLPGALSWQKSWIDRFKGKELILALDGDMAGRQGSKLILDSCSGIEVRVRDLCIPDKQDVNSLEMSGELDRYL